MQRAFHNVSALLADMLPFLERSGIIILMPTGDITQIKIDKYNEVFDFLSFLDSSEEWETVQNAWSLCTPERWAWYDDFDVTGLQEQQILNFACLHFAKLWRKHKPTGFFGRQIDEQSFEDSDS